MMMMMMMMIYYDEITVFTLTYESFLLLLVQ